MRRVILSVVLLGAVSVGGLAAQGRGRGQGQGPPNDREGLRRQVMERFVQNFVQQAGLDESQTVRFQEALRDQFRIQQELGERRRIVVQGLEEQMRPGIAADEAEINRLMEELLLIEEERASMLRSDHDRLAEFLSPTQRALFVLHFARFQRQVEMMLQRRGGGMPMGGPNGAGRFPTDFAAPMPDGPGAAQFPEFQGVN